MSFCYLLRVNYLSSRNGADRCGLFYALSLTLEKINIEHEIDVFNAVKRVRMTRPELIINEVRKFY